jgi:hypothetical protein
VTISGGQEPFPVTGTGTGRLTRRDRAWRDNEVVWGIESPQVPGVDAIRADLLALLRSDPGSHFFRFLDPDAGRYRRPRAAEYELFVHSVVRPGELGSGAERLPELVEQAQRESLGHLPFRFTAGPDWAIMRFCHALGDATTVWPMFMGLLRPDGLATYLAHEPDPAHPLLAALWSTFGRNPRRLRQALRAERTPLPLRASGSVPFGTGTTQLVGQRSAAGFRRELSALRKQVAPGASAVGMLVARATAAAREQGLEPFPGIAMVADVRRQLPGRHFAGGNFTAGSYLGIADPADPLAVTAAIDSYVASARPLLTLSLMAARAPGGRRTEPVWDDLATERSVITFSHVGKLPFPIDPPLRGLVLGKPIGRRGLAIVTHEIGRHLYVSVSFDERFVPRAAAAAVARALVRLD